ncbi:MAG: protein kinase [Phycisphaerales bacterium]|nr:protein kinase [Phycisphaerales bacterium]
MANERKLGAGQEFGNWKLVGDKELGKGGNGVVWEVETEAGERGAMKFLHKHHFSPPGARFARFRDEIAFLREEGRREGLLPLLDSNIPEKPSVENRPWLVTPLAIPLRTLDLRGASALQDLIRIMERVAVTLASMHEEGKFHRDIKPDNLFELDGLPVIGDFGLVDFPGKDAVTKETEFMGPLFFIAPEMMEGASDRHDGPADVYSLAKSIWVLASGQNYPLQGEMRADTPQLRLSTYCPHPRAHVLDLLIERSTRHNPSQRPSMSAFASELSAWLTVQDVTPTISDASNLAREYQTVFEVQKRNEQQRELLIAEARNVVSCFDEALGETARMQQQVTNIEPDIGVAYDLPGGVHYQGALGQPRLLFSESSCAEIGTGDLHRVRLQSFVMAESLSDDTIRVVAGHVIRYEVGMSSQAASLELPWINDATEARGSARLENAVRSLCRELVENALPAIRQFADQVKAVSK